MSSVPQVIKNETKMNKMRNVGQECVDTLCSLMIFLIYPIYFEK